MTDKQAQRLLFPLIASSLLLSFAIFAINNLGEHYQGNDYFPPMATASYGALLLISLGLNLTLGKSHRITVWFKQLLLFFIVFSLIALLTNAVQLTPFSPIDSHLKHWESVMGINLENWVAWTRDHPLLEMILTIAYASLPYQLAILPVMVILSKEDKSFYEFCILLLLTALLGFTGYYFFPTIAPASTYQAAVFAPDQWATGLKFYQIHHHLQPSTLEGGLIAMPSFHVIWGYLCLRLLRPWQAAWWLLATVNTTLVFACVLLGWHYPLDILGSAAVLFISKLIMNRICKRTYDQSELREAMRLI